LIVRLGVTALANVIPDMGALSSVNLLKNGVLMEQAKALANILKEHPTLKSLCGNSGEETELGMSGKEIGAEGAIMLAPEIAGNGSLTSLDISDNYLSAEGTKLLAEALKDNQIMTALNISSNYMTFSKAYGDGDLLFGDMSGVAALADAMPGMGALSVLSLKDNGLGTKAAGEVIGEMLEINCVLKELDLSGNHITSGDDCQKDRARKIEKSAVGFAQGVSKGLAANGALSTFIFSGEDNDTAVNMETSMTDFSGKGLGVSGVVMLSAFLPKCT
jgi:Ran GTPase-activating protein (RanGAP) involved in mRNA processing and transport